jgi:hypothetical protein
MAWYGMGLAHARLDSTTEAVTALEKVVELQPMSGEGFYQLGMAYHHANRPMTSTRSSSAWSISSPSGQGKLVQDAQRSDLMKLIPELPF